ncbi:hypothetical protein [Desulfovibrio sp.]|nr:hypothetical protein [Desulfovibrio sp.]
MPSAWAKTRTGAAFKPATAAVDAAFADTCRIGTGKFSKKQVVNNKLP